MDSKAIGEKLVQFCREQKNLEAIDTLYSPDILSVEPFGNEAMPAEMRGIDAVRGKNQWWIDNHEVHAASAEGPMVNGNRFSVIYDYEVTQKQNGQRTKMKEIAVYTVDNGKIVREEFFY